MSFSLPLPRFSLDRLPRLRRRRAPALGILATYTAPHVLQRHRRKLIALLVFFCLIYGAAFGLGTTYWLLYLMVPLLFLAAVIIWLLPDAQSAPVGLLNRMMFTFLVVLLLWPDYLAIAIPGLPWITAVRLVGTPLALLFLGCLSVSAPMRAEMAETLNATPLVWKCLVAFIVIALLSIGWSTDPTVSMNKFIVAAVNWFAVFFVAVYVFRTPGRAMRFAYLLWIIAVVVSLIGLQEWRHSMVPWAGHIPSFLKIEDENVQRILSGASRAGKGVYRVQSKFTTSLGLAEYYALICPFVLHFMFHARKLWVRLAAAACFPALFKMIVLTDSRLGMVGFFFSILFSVLLWGAWRWFRHRDSVFGPAVVLSFPALFVAFLTASFFVGRLRGLIWGDGSQQASTDSRKAQVAMGIPKILSHPWGYGMGRAGDALGYANAAGVVTIDTYYLAVTLEFGVIGFFIYYAIFVSGTAHLVRRVGRALSDEEMLIGPIGIALLNFLVIKSIFSQQENHALVFVMLGIATALCWRIDQSSKARAQAGAVVA